MSDEFIPCEVKELPLHLQYAAALAAIEINPLNAAPVNRLSRFGIEPEPQHVSVLTNKYWHTGGVKLTVGFVENVQAALAEKIVGHMNAWGSRCNVEFAIHSGNSRNAQVRISLRGQGYYSYLGVDVLQIPAGQPTMNLQGFSLNTPESEYRRVVRHETGHTLGAPHEHMRREIVARIDPQKAIAYFGQTQGWSAADVQAQVLTPIEESALLGTPHADVTSIMCYQLPGSITVDGRPIPGGNDIDESDYAFMAGIYPKPDAPTPPLPPTPPVVVPGEWTMTVKGKGDKPAVTFS